MQLTNDQIDVINAETLKQWPKEAVIAITADGAIPLENTHEDPVNYFRVDARAFYEAGGIALVHSHTYSLDEIDERAHLGSDKRVPSFADMTTQKAMDIPFGIVACDGSEVSPALWFPDLDSPLEGHEYTHGVHDCFRVLRAWYWQNLGTYINEHPRDPDWYIARPKMYIEEFPNEGFREIPHDELKVGDVLIIRLVGIHESHCGVYLGNDTFIHHENDKLSMVENYSRWRSRVTRVLRHKDNES